MEYYIKSCCVADLKCICLKARRKSKIRVLRRCAGHNNKPYLLFFYFMFAQVLHRLKFFYKIKRQKHNKSTMSKFNVSNNNIFTK